MVGSDARHDLDKHAPGAGPDLDDPKTGSLEGIADIVIETTAAGRPRPGWGKRGLQAGDRPVARAGMLEEPEGATRAKHSPALTQG